MKKEELLLNLSCILESETSIKLHVDKIAQLRSDLDEYLTDDERTKVTNKIRDKVQREAKHYWQQFGKKGAILMATGAGKSRVGALATADIVDHNPLGKILIVVPTEKLRDETWNEELAKWNVNYLPSQVEKTCYASLNKYEENHFDLVILDEGHNITENNAQFFQQNRVMSILWLSATKPKDIVKIQLLKRLNINPVYEITLDEAVKLGLVAPYDITVVTIPLDSKEKYIKAGTKNKPFYNSEFNHYGYLTRMCIVSPSKPMFLKRMRFIYDLRSKTKAAKWILENVIPQELRTLIFCGGKKQAIELCPTHFFSKPSKPKKINIGEKITASKQAHYDQKLAEYNTMMAHWQGDQSYDDFKEKRINRLSCVEAVNEGHNIPDLDCGFIVQLNSTELNLWQRIGRVVRFRPGHVAKIIILCVDGTEDKNWVMKSTKGLDNGNIKWVTLEDIQSGKETLNIN